MIALSTMFLRSNNDGTLKVSFDIFMYARVYKFKGDVTRGVLMYVYLMVTQFGPS